MPTATTPQPGSAPGPAAPPSSSGTTAAPSPSDKMTERTERNTLSHPTDSANWSPTEPRQASNVALRASDADRHATALILQDAIARGLLAPPEGGDRMSAAFAAVYLRDLEPLIADLPSATGTTKPAGW